MTIRIQLSTLSRASFHSLQTMKLLSTKNVPARNVRRSGTSRRKGPRPPLEAQPVREIPDLAEPEVDVERRSDRADRGDREDPGLEVILRLDGADEPRLPGEVGCGDVELLADQRVVAGDHEEGKLVDVRGAGDLDRSGTEAGLRHQERFRIEGAHEQARRGTLSQDHSVRGGCERELLVRHVANVVRIEVLR